MSQRNHSGSILPQDSSEEGIEQVGIGQAYSPAEIDELLYGDDRPAAERVLRLREFRDDLANQRTADFGGGDSDSAGLIEQIDDAIARIEAATSESEDNGGYDNTVPLPFDPTDHRELLSPDDDELAAIEEEDEDSIEEDILDPEEWDEGDDFRPERGVH